MCLGVSRLYWKTDLYMGKQSYHGANELVYSSHKEIILGLTVSGHVVFSSGPKVRVAMTRILMSILASKIECSY